MAVTEAGGSPSVGVRAGLVGRGLWGGVLFGAVMMVSDGDRPRPENAWKAQGIGLLTMTMPVTLYFAFCESSATRASLGKRMLGLAVSRETGERLSFRSVLLRNAVKFVPWEFGHTVGAASGLLGRRRASDLGVGTGDRGLDWSGVVGRRHVRDGADTV